MLPILREGNGVPYWPRGDTGPSVRGGIDGSRGQRQAFHLGKKNIASKVSKLIKSGVGPALNLQVSSGPPMAVNSSELLANAD